MAQAYECDKCGELYKTADEYTKVVEDYKDFHIYLTVFRDKDATIAYDLCSACRLGLFETPAKRLKGGKL